MSTVAEIEAVLPGLTMQELLHVESLLRKMQRRHTASGANPRLAALEALQKSLALDEAKTRAWQKKVQDARR
jgi:hypothetical protein